MKLYVFSFLTVFVCCSFFVESLLAQDPSNLDSIREKIRIQLEKTPFEQASLEMKIVNDRGQERTREMQVWLSTKKEVFKSLIKFQKPASVRGTGLLTLREGDVQTQKLYLPALKKVQTIGSSQKGDSFMSSDFTFEDIGQFETQEVTWKLVSESEEKWLIQSVPKDSQFDSLFIEIDRKMSQPVHIQYFKKGNQVKDLVFNDWNEIEKGVWRANELLMKNLETKGFTVLKWTERSFEAIPDSYFSERMLSRRN